MDSYNYSWLLIFVDFVGKGKLWIVSNVSLNQEIKMQHNTICPQSMKISTHENNSIFISLTKKKELFLASCFYLTGIKWTTFYCLEINVMSGLDLEWLSVKMRKNIISQWNEWKSTFFGIIDIMYAWINLQWPCFSTFKRMKIFFLKDMQSTVAVYFVQIVLVVL